MIDAAIVGLGWWGKTLVRSVQGKSSELRFVAGTTGRRALAEEFAAEAGLTLADDLAAVLDHPGVRVVVLATPHLDHERQVVAAARAGKHVFVEKPFTLDKASAERAVAAVRDAGVVLGLGHNRRFHPNMAELRDRVRSGSLGTILHCEGTMTAPNGLFLARDSWRADPRQSPAGGMAGLGIHMVDGMIDVIGEIAEVSAVSHHRAAPSGAQDTTAVMLRFADGASGYISCMTATAPSYRFCVYGSSGIAEITTQPLDRLTIRPAPDAPLSGHPTPKPVEERHRPGIDTVRLELEAFAAAADGGTAFPIGLDEMVHGVAVFEAIARSATQGQPVPVARDRP